MVTCALTPWCAEIPSGGVVALIAIFALMACLGGIAIFFKLKKRSAQKEQSDVQLHEIGSIPSELHIEAHKEPNSIFAAHAKGDIEPICIINGVPIYEDTPGVEVNKKRPHSSVGSGGSLAGSWRSPSN